MRAVELDGKRESAFIFNNWYIAGTGGDITGEPLARRICDIPLVLFRTRSGAVAALEDRCAHRGMALSAGGKCLGETIQCPYHGLEFDTGGICVRIPGLERVSPDMRIRSFPVVEKDAVVWIWMGDAAGADPARIPSHPYHSDSSYVWSRGVLEVNANWEFLNDNLLDLTHVQYAHRNTIGGNPDEDARAQIKVQRNGRRVVLTRWLRDTACPPFHKQLYGFKGRIDRVQEVEFTPGYIFLHSSSMDVGDSVDEGWRRKGMHFYQMHAITPQTPTRTLYMFTMSRNFKTEDRALTEQIHALSMRTFEEDKAMLEVQQARCTEYPDIPLVATKHDTATAQARRIVREMMAEEVAGDQRSGSGVKDLPRPVGTAAVNNLRA
jgi:phenylpropionate dioxygenase-like ring-hydroxylating dioxygenase large terminal subunit